MSARARAEPCRTCSGPDPVVRPAACPTCGGRGLVDPGPQSVASALQELLRRATAAAPAGALPAPTPGAPAPPRPWCDTDDGEEA